MAAEPRLSDANLEALCGILGDTGTGLTGSEIGRFLRDHDRRLRRQCARVAVRDWGHPNLAHARHERRLVWTRRQRLAAGVTAWLARPAKPVYRCSLARPPRRPDRAAL